MQAMGLVIPNTLSAGEGGAADKGFVHPDFPVLSEVNAGAQALINLSLATQPLCVRAFQGTVNSLCPEGQIAYIVKMAKNTFNIAE